MIGLLARCGPLSLLASSFVLTLGGLFLRDLTAVLAGLLAEVVLLVVLVGRTGFPLVRLVPAVVATAGVMWSNWLLADPRSLTVAAVAGLRVAFFVVGGLVFVSYLDPFTLGDHLGQRLRLPARPVLATVAALQRLDTLADDWVTLDRARHAKGLGPGRDPLSRLRHVCAMTFALLVEAIRQAGRMTVAMEARGYSAGIRGVRRTWLEPAPWRPADTLLLVLTTALAVFPHVVHLATTGGFVGMVT